MMQPCETHYLVISGSNAGGMEGSLPDVAPRFYGTEAIIYSFGGTLPFHIHSAMDEAGLKEERLMDRVHFVLQDDPMVQQALYDEFFDFIALDYESLIEPERNVDNIENLIRDLSQFLGGISGKLIMDFGCGTGLATKQLQQARADFVGVDQSLQMRQFAAGRGMQVSTIKKIQQEGLKFDGVIASYVLHLISAESVIAGLAQCLRPGGVLVGNYHKGLNIAWGNELFRSHGCQVVEVPSETTRHGAYFAYVRE